MITILVEDARVVVTSPHDGFFAAALAQGSSGMIADAPP